MKFIPSKYSIAIADAFRNTDRDILIKACPGSGKSTNLLEISKIIPETSSYIFLAFNKEIKEAMSHKLGMTLNGEVSTMHSLGSRSIMDHFKHRIELKENKCWEFAFKLNKQWRIPSEDFSQTIVLCKQLVDLYRNTMCSNMNELQRQADEMGIDYAIEHLDYVQDLLQEYRRHNLNPTMIDFPDMIYIPVTNSKIRIKSGANNILVDEVQDLNRAQHALIRKLKEQNRARLVMVGDENQAIYKFAGSDANSFDLCKKYEGIIELPLSICYRCSKAVLADASKVYQGILEPTDWAIDGKVELNGDIKNIEEGDMVICRNVKPLIKLFFDLLLLHKKAMIRGKDLGKGILDLIKECKKNEADDIEDELIAVLNKKAQKLRERGKDKPYNHPSYQAVLEKVLVLQVIMMHHKTKPEIIKFLETVFSDDDRDGRGKVILSTIHKAKGLEADHIFILDVNLIPSKYAITPEQRIQEKNLLWVATSRAKISTTYIYSKKGEDKEKDKLINSLYNTY